MSIIFLSHSSHNSDVATEFKMWLHSEGHESVFLDFDPDAGIPPGKNWERELYQQLRLCRAVIFLISEQFLASRWCFAEMTLARSLGKAILPAKVSACAFDDFFSDLQAIDFIANREDGFKRLRRGLRVAGVKVQEQFEWVPSRSPYPGLMAFQEEDAAVYFGREKDVARALEILTQIRRYEGPGLLLILGASGSGKSSLVRAGVIPRLKRDPDQWLVLKPFRPGAEPFKELASVLSDGFIPAESGRDWQSLYNLFKSGLAPGEAAASFNECIKDLRRRTARESTVVVTIDQFEELFGKEALNATNDFLSFLHAALEGPDRAYVVIATLRSDFLEQYQKTPGLRGMAAHELLLGQMGVENLTDVIEKPARVAGIELEPALLQALLHDAATDDALPLLAFTLRALYEGYAQDGFLKASKYRDDLGGLQGSVAKAAKAVIASKPLSKTEEEELRKAFLSLALIDESGHYIRRVVPWAEFPEVIHEVLERFVQARLLVSMGDGQQRVLEVAHEALFRAWDTLSEWLKQNRESLRLRQELNQASARWAERGRTEEYLWRGGQLARAVELRDKKQLPLDKEALNFLAVSEKAATSAERRRRRRRNLTVLASLVIAVGMSLLAVSEWRSRRTAEEQRQIAVSGQLALQSQDRLKEEPDLALLLAAESRRTAETVDARHSLLTALTQTCYIGAFLGQHPSSIEDIDISPDGQKLAAAVGFEIVIYDLATMRPDGKPLVLGNDITSSAHSVRFSPNGETIAAATVGGRISLWDARTREPRGVIRGQFLHSMAVAFDPSGDRIAVSGCVTGSSVKGAELIKCEQGQVTLYNINGSSLF